MRDRTRRLRAGWAAARSGGGGGGRQTITATAVQAFERAGTQAATGARALRKTTPTERRKRLGRGEAGEADAAALLRTPRRVAREALCQTGFRLSSCDVAGNGRQTSKAGCAGARPLSSQTRVPKRPRRRSPARRSDGRSWASHAAGQRGGEIGGGRARQRRPRRRTAARATIRRPTRPQLMARRRQARRLRRLELRHARRWSERRTAEQPLCAASRGPEAAVCAARRPSPWRARWMFCAKADHAPVSLRGGGRAAKRQTLGRSRGADLRAAARLIPGAAHALGRAGWPARRWKPSGRAALE